MLRKLWHPHWVRFVARYIEQDDEEWWEAFTRVSLIFISACAGFVWLFLSPRWFHSPSYVYVNDLHVSFRVWGGIFLAQALLIAMPLRVRLLGYLLGFITCTFFGIMLTASALKGYSASPLGFSGLIAFGVIHLAGTRNYLFKRAERIARASVAEGI